MRFNARARLNKIWPIGKKTSLIKNLLLQSRTKLLEKVFPIMSTFLRNKTISKTTPLREENPFPRFNVASQKRPGIRLSFEYTTTMLSGEGGEGRTGTATMFRKMLSKYTIFSTVLSKIVALKKKINHFSRLSFHFPNSFTGMENCWVNFKTFLKNSRLCTNPATRNTKKLWMFYRNFALTVRTCVTVSWGFARMTFLWNVSACATILAGDLSHFALVKAS